MKSILIKVLIGILIFATSLIISAFSLLFDYTKESWGIGALMGFFLFFLTISLYLKFFKNKITVAWILIIATLAMLTFTIGMTPSSRFILKTLPSILCLSLGILAGFVFDKMNGKKKIIYPTIILIIPLLFNLNLYSLWVHKVEFGNFFGDVSKKTITTFEFTNKEGKLVNNESLKGSIVLFDFWFINCGPCWVKFPKLEEIYQKYKSNPSVKLFAVNRPMKRDKPMELYTKIEEKGYAFPVLKGDQETIDSFNVYKYPTVIVLNQNGEISYMGTIDDVEKKIEELLDAIE